MPGIGDNIFIHHFKLWYQYNLEKKPKLCVVISDVRFQNEANFIQGLNGIIIKIDRSHITRTDDLHQSETESQMISYDHLINNIYTIDDFYKNLEDCVYKNI